jgi:ABC-2 type transport system permease protein
VRRELWENRSLYIAPLATAAVVLFGFLISTTWLPHKMRGLAALDPAKQAATVVMPYSFAAFMILLTAFVVGIFYCLDALNGERRDRSILFWKSMPVSDRTTVLAKASLPLLALPLLVYVIIAAIWAVMFLLSTVVLLGNGSALTALWVHLPLLKMSVALFYGLTTMALWHAPLYSWLLLVSAWARRATFLWAALPLLAICFFEAAAFRTSHFAHFLGYRVIGWFKEAFVAEAQSGKPMDPLMSLDPGKFLTAPGLWIGLAAAALFLAAAIRLRRNREPM